LYKYLLALNKENPLPIIIPYYIAALHADIASITR